MAENEQPNTPFVFAAGQHRSKADDFFNFYANNVSITFTTWETSLIFGEITGQREGKPVVEEIAKVTMTREFAKVVSQLLAMNLAAYEKRFGEIKSPHFDLGENAVVDFGSLSRSPSMSPSSSASPSPEPEETDADT